MSSFKIGDVVRLKSGGPAMTVISTNDPRGDHSRLCAVWADTGGYHEHWIAVAVLEDLVQRVAFPSSVQGAETCKQCRSVLMFSARARGDGLCGPCSRGAEFKVRVGDVDPVVLKERALDAEFAAAAGCAFADDLDDPRPITSCEECGRTARVRRGISCSQPWLCANCAPKVKPAHANGVPPRESGG